MKQSLTEQIETKKIELDRTPLRSNRRIILFVQLRDLMLRKLRKEIKRERKAA